MVHGEIFFLHDPMHPNEVSCFLSPRALYCQHQLGNIGVWRPCYYYQTKAIFVYPNSSCLISTDQRSDFKNSSHGLKWLKVNLSLSLMCCCTRSLGWYPCRQTTVSLKSWWDHFSHNYSIFAEIWGFAVDMSDHSPTFNVLYLPPGLFKPNVPPYVLLWYNIQLLDTSKHFISIPIPLKMGIHHFCSEMQTLLFACLFSMFHIFLGANHFDFPSWGSIWVLAKVSE